MCWKLGGANERFLDHGFVESLIEVAKALQTPQFEDREDFRVRKKLLYCTASLNQNPVTLHSDVLVSPRSVSPIYCSKEKMGFATETVNGLANSKGGFRDDLYDCQKPSSDPLM